MPSRADQTRMAPKTLAYEPQKRESATHALRRFTKAERNDSPSRSVAHLPKPLPLKSALQESCPPCRLMPPKSRGLLKERLAPGDPAMRPKSWPAPAPASA